jgi:hypothetical protein
MIAGGLGLFILTRGKRGLGDGQIKAELRGIRAEAEAERLVAELGHEKAVKAIETHHADAVAKLDHKEKLEAETLRKDPKKLSRFLVNAGTRKP